MKRTFLGTSSCLNHWRNSDKSGKSSCLKILLSQEISPSKQLKIFSFIQYYWMLCSYLCCCIKWRGNNPGTFKKNVTISRLELVSGHMVANMFGNVRNVLKRYPVTSYHGWLDSTVALYWIKDTREYKQFVANRVRKIREKNNIGWRYVLTDQSPSDQSSRGVNADKLKDTWFKGPRWLSKI